MGRREIARVTLDGRVTPIADDVGASIEMPYASGGFYSIQDAWDTLKQRQFDVNFLMIIAAVGAASGTFPKTIEFLGTIPRIRRWNITVASVGCPGRKSANAGLSFSNW